MLPPPAGIRHALALAEIAAAAEGALRTLQNEAQRSIVVDVEVREAIAQLGHHLRVHGVADLGSMQGDNPHPVRADCDFYGLIAHACLVGAVALLPCNIACPPTSREAVASWTVAPWPGAMPRHCFQRRH